MRSLDADFDTFVTLYVEKIYYPTYTRLDGLLTGVLLAAMRLVPSRMVERVHAPREHVSGRRDWSRRRGDCGCLPRASLSRRRWWASRSFLWVWDCWC